MCACGRKPGEGCEETVNLSKAVKGEMKNDRGGQNQAVYRTWLAVFERIGKDAHFDAARTPDLSKESNLVDQRKGYGSSG